MKDEDGIEPGGSKSQAIKNLDISMGKEEEPKHRAKDSSQKASLNIEGEIEQGTGGTVPHLVQPILLLKNARRQARVTRRVSLSCLKQNRWPPSRRTVG